EVRSAEPGESHLELILKEFRAPTWQRRADAFYALTALGGPERDFIPRPLHLAIARFGAEANQIHLALITLLGVENRAVHWSEEYMNYYGDLIEAVGVLGDSAGGAAVAGRDDDRGRRGPPAIELWRVRARSSAGTLECWRYSGPARRIGSPVGMLTPLNRSLAQPRRPLAPWGRACPRGKGSERTFARRRISRTRCSR